MQSITLEKLTINKNKILRIVWAFDYFKDVTSVLDLFLGSGSTLIACEKTNRICYGMELDPYYCDVIIKRYEEYTNNKAVLVRG